LLLDAAALDAYRGLARLRADAGDIDRALAVIARGLAAAAANAMDASISPGPPRASGAVSSSAAAAEPRAGAMTLRSADLWVERARVLLRRDADGDATEAVGVLQQVLNLRPRDVDAGRLFVAGLDRLGRRQDLVGAFVSLGASLEAEGIEAGRAEATLREAVRAYEGALALKPDCLRAWLRLADVQLALGEPRAAVRSLEAAVAIDPEQPAAHVNLGWARRMTGDFVGGWRESVWHYRAGDKRRFEQPAWDGSPLGSRTLLLWADFALGDTIQDLRFLPLVRAAHPQARLIVECHHTLVSLLDASRALLGIDAVIATKAPLPAFDLQLPLRRVQEQFVLDVDAIPAATPYITVDPARAVRWRQRVEGLTTPGGQRRIGIVWAGEQTRIDARIKSAALADFAPLAAFHRQGLRLFSLQAGPHVDELIAPPRGLRVARLLEEAGDVAETAAAMRALDLVITVDTMTAHLAGALGVPVWVLTAHAPAWWLWHVLPPDSADGTTRSRWYPSMRLFQQTRAGDWAGVMQQVCEVLGTDQA
jgi:tetratricopeptide (TPR) repeat protein